MYKIAAVGDRESVLVYKAFGMETVPASSSAEASSAIKRLADEEYTIIFLTEQLAVQMPELIAKYADRVSPAIILIPGSQGSLGIGMSAISAAVEQAVGADIFASSDAGRMENDEKRKDS